MSLRLEAPMADYEDAVNEASYYAEDFTFVPYTHPEPPVLEIGWQEPLLYVQSREPQPEDPYLDMVQEERKLPNFN